MDQIIIISAIFVFFAIILLIRTLKRPSIVKKDEELEILELKSVKANNPKEGLEKITSILKLYIKRRYGLNNKLSLDEITKQLKIKDNWRLISICKVIQKDYYTNKRITSKEIEKLKKQVIDTIKTIEINKRRQKEKEKNKETILDKVKNKQAELGEEIRIQKILHSKLKNKDIKP
jgi:hypothetical protein